MAKCVVKSCPHKTGEKLRFPSVTLHAFPNNIHMIRNWLLQTGDYYEDIDAMAAKVLKGKKSDTYRMCSRHFTYDCYMRQGSKTVLKPGAVPTVFINLPPLLPQITESGIPFKKSDEGASTSSSIIVRITKHLVTVQTQTESKYFFVNAGTNTDIYQHRKVASVLTDPPPDKREMECQTDLPLPNENWSMMKDHLCSRCRLNAMKNVQPPRPTKMSVETTRVARHLDPVFDKRGSESMRKICRKKSMIPREESNDLYHPVEVPTAMDESEMNSTIQTVDVSRFQETYSTEQKFIVFESCLTSLLFRLKCQHSHDCHAPIVKIEKIVEGSLLTVHFICQKNHRSFTWHSQPLSGNVSIGNLIMASSVLFSGSSFQKVSEMFHIFGIAAISHRTYEYFQNNYIYPAIDYNWKKEQSRLAKEIEGKELIVATDGRFDSLGFSEKYCTYAVMNICSDAIITFKILPLQRGKSSVGIKNEAFHECLEELQEKKIDIKAVATNRYRSIQNLMAAAYPTMDHQIDVWHLCKYLAKKLTTESARRGCQDLSFWISPIVNHLWWASQTCEQNADVLEDKWRSVFYHVADVHTFPNLANYPKCKHPKLMPAQKQNTKWIKSSSTAHSALEQIVNDPALIKDIRKTNKFCHTRNLEVFQSKLLKYKPGRLSSNMDDVIARTTLAVLSHNRNVHREQVVLQCPSSTSQPLGSRSSKIVFPKKWWVAKPTSVACKDDHVFDILKDAIKIMDGTLVHHWTSSILRSAS